MPKVVRNLFWRILLFYILSVLILGLNIPYTTPGLNHKNTRTSPFTLVFQMAGSQAAGSFINAVIMTSVLSAGNHALFAGTRLLYTLAIDKHAPRFFGHLNRIKSPGLQGWLRPPSVYCALGLASLERGTCGRGCKSESKNTHQGRFIALYTK